MDPLITTATSYDEQDHAARVAVLPVGSFEQHGDFLPIGGRLLAFVWSRVMLDRWASAEA